MLQQAGSALRAQFTPQAGTLLTRALLLDELMAKRDASYLEKRDEICKAVML